MVKDNEKYEDSDESEYHFSDDDVSYEIDTETTRPPVENTQKPNILGGLTRSKRMLFGVVIFLVLLVIVYKLVTPYTATQTTDITATTSPQPTPQLAQPQPVVTRIPTTPMVSTPMPSTSASPITTSTQAQVPTNPSATLPISPRVPPIIPPGSSSPQTVSPISTTNTMPNAQPTNVDSLVASMASENEKLINQVRTEYAQKLDEATTENKVLQDQMQALNSRVANLESQLAQLVQELTRANQAQQDTTQQVSSQQAPVAATTSETKVPYNVQAIIPGRAWLRADNGETLTVAEGDTIKGLGRVTKIDPYDGVVEINIGNKILSLSYGNGGG